MSWTFSKNMIYFLTSGNTEKRIFLFGIAGGQEVDHTLVKFMIYPLTMVAINWIFLVFTAFCLAFSIKAIVLSSRQQACLLCSSNRHLTGSIRFAMVERRLFLPVYFDIVFTDFLLIC